MASQAPVFVQSIHFTELSTNTLSNAATQSPVVPYTMMASLLATQTVPVKTPVKTPADSEARPAHTGTPALSLPLPEVLPSVLVVSAQSVSTCGPDNASPIPTVMRGDDMERIVRAVVVIQRVWRWWVQRNKAAIVIQRFWRRYRIALQMEKSRQRELATTHSPSGRGRTERGDIFNQIVPSVGAKKAAMFVEPITTSKLFPSTDIIAGAAATSGTNHNPGKKLSMVEMLRHIHHLSQSKPGVCVARYSTDPFLLFVLSLVFSRCQFRWCVAVLHIQQVFGSGIVHLIITQEEAKEVAMYVDPEMIDQAFRESGVFPDTHLQYAVLPFAFSGALQFSMDQRERISAFNTLVALVCIFVSVL
jgi:hypothetical protein